MNDFLLDRPAWDPDFELPEHEARPLHEDIESEKARIDAAWAAHNL
ncbi:MAG: hypothetical protein GYA39_04060 [Methanothrix sp.]|nr:hypothetical protein [Methanothrix sp.]